MASAGLSSPTTAVKAFSEDLDNLFGIREPLKELTQQVEEKKRLVSTQEQELEALQTRIREAEQRLAQVTRSNAAVQANDSASSGPKALPLLPPETTRGGGGHDSPGPVE